MIVTRSKTLVVRMPRRDAVAQSSVEPAPNKTMKLGSWLMKLAQARSWQAAGALVAPQG